MTYYYNRLSNESYDNAVERLSKEDSNAYGQKVMSIAARIKNQVVMSSDVDTRPGSDMFMLASYMAHALSGIYKSIGSSDASDGSKIAMANAVKDAESTASKFAESLKTKRDRIKTEERKRRLEERNKDDSEEA